MEQRLNYLVAGVFVALIFLSIILVTAILPAMTFQPQPSDVAINYTELARVPKNYSEDDVHRNDDLENLSAEEAFTARKYRSVIRGRDIYRREGCFYCHTQFVRYQDSEAGELVAAGDYVYETPHILGTERTGPDLSNIGGKYEDAWHVAHHTNPRAVKPGSIMPSFSYLTEHEMKDLVVYLQEIGSRREQPAWLVPPQEYRDKFHHVQKGVNVNASAVANAGRGIFMQNCAQCHGVEGRGNGPVSATMQKKPANFTRPFFSAYSDEMWYWRVYDGVPGTRMPRWGRNLSDEDILYLVAFLKTLPLPANTPAGEIEVTKQSQVDVPQHFRANFWEIDRLNKPEKAYYYGGGRH